MHNKVVFRSARALEEVGFETLRFNYRGVGASSGSYDRGIGETEDAATALAFLRSAQPAAERCLVLGFSFGADIAFRLAAEVGDVDRIVSIGTPAYALDAPHARGRLDRTFFIHGADDEIAPLGALRAILARIGAETEIEVVAGADHFFTGHLAELQAAVKIGSRESGVESRRSPGSGP
jgi:alpha/beta superfamily hydrolase